MRRNPIPRTDSTVRVIDVVQPHCSPDHDEPDHDEPDHDEPDHVEPDHDEPDQVEPDQLEPDHDEQYRSLQHLFEQRQFGSISSGRHLHPDLGRGLHRWVRDLQQHFL